ncbi:MAG TPA: hypothetical protein PLQ93_03015 [Bacteroidia bacterium]|nr:hypothetical protein [Bacteroidia bacterium]
MKRINQFKFLFLMGFLMLGLITACTKDKTPAPPEPCDPNKVYYSNDIFPIMASSCAKSGCHDATSKQEGLDLSTYKGLMEIVKPGNPGGSKIMEVINLVNNEKSMPPLPNPPLSQSQKDMISKWISEGALNNYCVNSNCNTDSITYTKDIKDMLVNCQACHSGSVISKGVDLSSYAGTKAAGQSGKLYNAVAQNGMATAMPQAPAPKLSDCNVSKIDAWVKNGMPEK